MGVEMMKINELTIEDLIRVAEDDSLSRETAKKVKIYAISRLGECVNDENLTKSQKEFLGAKISEYKADVFGVSDMGYPYEPMKNASVPARNYTDMYCASEPIQ